MRFLAPFAFAALVAAVAPAVADDTIVLKYATLNPPGSTVGREFNHRWADKINAAGKGAVRVSCSKATRWATS
jgi:hypothetical protein